MKCSVCQFENPAEMLFCGKCGAKLEKVCPQCNFANPAQFAFCGKCGFDFGLPAERSKTELSFNEKLSKIQKYLPQGLTEKILSQRDRIEGERKQVTVMFCDLANYTAISDNLGPEKTYRLMDDIYELLIHEVHRYEGTVNELTGDGILALFGAPIALEDAPQRAVRSALFIQREMAGRAIEKGINLRLRIGIHTGMVVVGTVGNDLRVDFKAVGDTVNLAARLEQLAEPGSIVVSENTYRLVEGLFRVEALGEKNIKGKNEPISIFRVMGSGKSRSRFEARAQSGLTRFVGRERELEIFQDCFDRVRKEKGQALSIVAEAGMGKSRLLYEFRKSLANEDITFLEGRCVSYGQNNPYLPLIDVLKSNFKIEPDDSPKKISAKVEKGWKQIDPNADQTIYRNLPFLLELFSVVNGFEALKDMEPETKRRKTFEVIKDLSLKGSQVRPLVIAFEDLHWIDKTSEETIKQLMEHIAGARIFLIFTFRSNYIPPWGGKTYYSQITLNRLSNRESFDMIRHLLDADVIAEDLAGLILEKTEGVPFFIEEFTRSLQDSGSVKKTDQGCRLADDLSNISIPETLHDLLMARVDRLPESVKDVLQVGAVIEREFSWLLLKDLTGLDEIDLLSRLSHLKEAELIFERGIFPQVNYIFQHALTRELVYNSLLETKRKSHHLNIAKTMERLYADRPDEHFPILALHFTQGGALEKGYFYHHLAGNSAARSYAIQEALEHFREAWRLIDKMEPEQKTEEKRLETAIKLAEVMETLGEFESTISLPRGVFKSPIGRQNPKNYAGVHYWMGHTLGNQGQYDEARKHLHRALKLSKKNENFQILGAAHDYLGQLDFFQGYLNRSMKHMEAAVRCLREVGHKSQLAWSVAFKTLIFCELEKPHNWQAELEAADDLIQRSGNDRAGCLLYGAKCRNSIKIGHYNEALKYAQDGLKLAEKIGEGIQIPFLLCYAARAALHLANDEYALQLVKQAVAESDRVGHPLAQNFSRVVMAEVLLRLNKIETILETVQTSLEFCRRLDLGWLLLQTLDINAEVLAHCTPPDEKQINDLMDHAEAMIERIDLPWFRINHLLSKARINIQLKDFTVARDCLEAVRALYRKLGLENETDQLRAIEKEIEEQKSDDRCQKLEDRE